MGAGDGTLLIRCSPKAIAMGSVADCGARASSDAPK
jgi:hypothetical protein